MKKMILILAVVLTPALAVAQTSDVVVGEAVEIEHSELVLVDDAAEELPSFGDEVPDDAPVAKVEEAPLQVGFELVAAVKDGNWRLVISILLALVMFGLAKYRDEAKKITIFKGDRGGAILVGILGIAGAMSLALGTDEKVSVSLLLGGLAAAWTAVGGVHWAKRLIWPKDKEDGKNEDDSTTTTAEA